MVKSNEYYSYNQKELPKGCQYCVRGEKVVLFVTGLCPRKCYFCPVSDQKYGHDVQFANEREVTEIKDVIAEAKAMDAKGAGITGGDPLVKVDRVCENIKALKQEFGKEFHIHLYTSLNLVTAKTLEKLFTAGLDEIRFHFDLDDTTLWDKVSLASTHPWDVGVEVPLVPGKEKELQKLLDFIHNKVLFLNLNELERSDNALSKLTQMGMKTKAQFSYAIQGSLKTGFDMMKYSEEKGYDIAIHLCTATLKDRIQLTNRIKREGETSKQSFDIIDKEGLLHRGAIYVPEMKPGFSYREKLASVNKEDFTSILKDHMKTLKEKVKIKDIFLDTKKLRLLLSKKDVKKHRNKIKRLKLIPAIVVEYPTADQLEIEIDFL